MTDNKRFNYNVDRNCIEDNGEFLATINDGGTIANKLNDLSDEYEQLKKENEQLKQQKRFLKIHDDYYIQYGDDKELFDLHKPADIRSLCIILNREHGFSELQCEYNDKELE